MQILKRFFGAAEETTDQSPARQEEPADDAVRGLSVQVDRPIRNVADDMFDQASFAKQIAETISRRGDPSSLVIGIYKPWGDGKTSTLAMVNEYLEPHADVRSMEYNPWFYGDSTEQPDFFVLMRQYDEKGRTFYRIEESKLPRP